MSPDWASRPVAVPYSNLSDPQSLNLYSYVTNNPLSLVDADGLDENTGEQANVFKGGDASALTDGTPEGNAAYNTLQNWMSGSAHTGGQALLNSPLANPDNPIYHQTSIDYVLSDGDGSLFTEQKFFAAKQIGLKAGNGQSPDDIRQDIQDSYDGLRVDTGLGNHDGLVGGNWNFSIYDGRFNIATLFAHDRNGFVPSVHIHRDEGYFHVDTANPYFLYPVHGFVDQLLGNTVWKSGIPR